MRVQTKAPSGPWMTRPRGMKLLTSAIFVLVVVAMLTPPVLGSESVLSLEEALERALRHHPTVWDATAGARQTELAWEGQQAQRRLQASVSTDVARMTYDSGEDDGVKFTSGLTLDRPVSMSASWQLAAGTTISLSGIAGEKEGSGNVLSINFNRQLWPNPSLSEAELGRQNAQEALNDLPLQARQAQAAALIDVYRRYRALQIQEARLDLLASQVEGAIQRYTEVVAQFELGLASADDVIQAELERDRVFASYEREKRELALSRRSFFRDLGLDEHADYRLAPLPEKLDYTFLSMGQDEAIERALSTSNDLRSAERNLRAAETRYEAAKTSKLSASFSAGTSLADWDASPVYSAFVVASYDLADGGSAEIKRQEAELNLERARRAVESARSAVIADVDRRLSDLEWLAEQVRFAEVSLELAERTLEARVQQKLRGVTTTKAVEESRRAVEEARLSYVDAVVAYQAAQWELMSLMGEELLIDSFLEHSGP